MNPKRTPAGRTGPDAPRGTGRRWPLTAIGITLLLVGMLLLYVDRGIATAVFLAAVVMIGLALAQKRLRNAPPDLPEDGGGRQFESEKGESR